MQRSPLVEVATFIIIIAGIIYARSIITPFLLALFISIICAQAVTWLVEKGIPKSIALVIVMLGLFSIFSGFSLLIGGTISSFSRNVSKYGSSLTAMTNSFISFLNEHGLNIPQDQVSNFIQPAKIFEFTAGALGELFQMVSTAFLVYLTILFILMEFGSFPVKAKAIWKGADGSLSYFSAITRNIRHYLGLKTLFSVSTGILIYIALLIIGVDYPLMWALIAGLLNYIPNIGSAISAIPAALFALVQLGIGGALWTVGSFLFAHAVIGSFVEPRVMGKGLGLSTLVVFLSLLFWGFILGMVGMFLSVPLTMSIKIILEQNEKTRWLAILLGTPAEAELYLQQKEMLKGQEHRNSSEKITETNEFIG